MKKSERAPSLRRKCFGKSNLHLLDLHSVLPDKDSSTSHVDAHTPTLTVEDVDSKPSPTPRRKLGSVMANTPTGDICLPLDMKHRNHTLNQSVSSSSIDSGIDLNPTSSLSSPSHSKRPSREGFDISSPLVEATGLVSITERQQPERTETNTKNLSSEEHTDHVPADTCSRILDGEVFEDVISTAEDEDELTARTERLSISREALDNLWIAAQELLRDAQCQTQAPLATTLKKSPLGGSALTLPTERDGPCHINLRRHSSADPCIPLTQRSSRMLERKRSVQPSFHRSSSSKDDDSSRTRKKSACIVCERKQRKTSRSAPSVIIRTAMTPDHQKKRRYSEILKVYKPSEIPFTEVRLMKIEELSQKVKNGMDERRHEPLSRKQALPLPDSTTPSSQAEMVKSLELAKDEQLQNILESNMPKFLDYTDWSGLFAHLVSKGLLNNERREILLCPRSTSTEKGNFFYGQALPKMGHEVTPYVKLYQCLNETKTDHPGHATLYNLLHESLGNDQYCDVTGSLDTKAKSKTL